MEDFSQVICLQLPIRISAALSIDGIFDGTNAPAQQHANSRIGGTQSMLPQCAMPIVVCFGVGLRHGGGIGAFLDCSMQEYATGTCPKESILFRWVSLSMASTKVAGLSRLGIFEIQGGAVRPRMLLASAVQLSIPRPGLPAGRRPGLASCGRSEFWYY